MLILFKELGGITVITLIGGPMYGGKSTTLIQKMERYIYAKKSVCFIRPKKDNRGYITHGGLDDIQKILREGDGLFEIEEFTIDAVHNFLDHYDAVFVDEFFMIKNCKLLCTEFSIRTHSDIYFAGLLSTSDNELFKETIEILPYCDEIIKLNGVCMGLDGKGCGSQHGNYSGYFGKGTKDSNGILVGDNEYRCLCRKCYKIAIGKL